MPTNQIIKDIWQGLVDLVYPPKCLVCGDMQPEYLCSECAAQITKMTPPLCLRCGAPLDDGRCDDCRHIEYCFDSAIAIGIYEGVLKEAIHQLKYSGHTVMGPVLSNMLVELLRSKPCFLTRIECVIALPIHPSRERERGFNQAELLAVQIGRAFPLPILKNVLIRSRATTPQVDLSGEDRRENIVGAFEVARREAVEGRVVLLIDDVFTTGSTCNSAASALRDAGAKEIHVLTVARSV